MRQLVVVVGLLVGCGDVVKANRDAAALDDAPATADDATVDAAIDGPSGPCIDNFDDNMIDPMVWMVDAPNSPIGIAEVAGRLRVTVPATGGGNFLSTKKSFVFAGSTTQLQLVSLPADSETSWFFSVGNAARATTVRVGSYGNSVVQPYIGSSFVTVTTTDRYWRIREAAGTTFVESGPNGTTWTVRLSGATPAITDGLLFIGGAIDIGTGGLYEVDNLEMSVTGNCPLR